MKRRSREINIFSLSAIDLFACAMGAFLLLSIILFQYYLKAQQVPDPVPQPVTIDRTAPLEDQIQQLEQALEESAAREASARQEASAAEQQAQALKDESARNRQLAFLGIVTQAKSFVILIDMSGSMEDYDALMVRTVGELLSQMDDAYQCQIIGFQGHVEDSHLKPTLTTWQPQGTVVAMTDANIRAAEAFCRKLVGNFRSGTPTFLALSSALKYPVEAIFLLTDGGPTDIENGGEIVRRITAANKPVKKIFTIAIGDYRKFPRLVEFLDALARNNDGKFLGISD